MKRYLAIVAAGLVLTSAYTQDRQPADFVNPFIGASTSIGKAGVLHGLGKTFPGAATPPGAFYV